jgi:hypothetical protein
LRAQIEHGAQLLAPSGSQDGVGRPLGRSGSQSHQVGVALAGGVQDPFAVVIAHALGTEDPS